MATFYSTCMTLYRARPSLQMVPAGMQGIAVYPFNYTVPAGNLAALSVIELNIISGPANQYFMLGLYWASAMSSAGGDASVQMGLYPVSTRTTNHGLAAVKETIDDNFFLGTTTVDALTSSVGFGLTEALGNDTLLYPGDIITATVITEDWVAAGTFRGYFMTRW